MDSVCSHTDWFPLQISSPCFETRKGHLSVSRYIDGLLRLRVLAEPICWQNPLLSPEKKRKDARGRVMEHGMGRRVKWSEERIKEEGGGAQAHTEKKHARFMFYAWSKAWVWDHPKFVREAGDTKKVSQEVQPFKLFCTQLRFGVLEELAVVQACNCTHKEGLLRSAADGNLRCFRGR